MHNSTAQILEKLKPYWHLIVRRPLSDGEVHEIETSVKLPMPAYLREYLQIIGLFQDAFGGEIQIFQHRNEFAQERSWLLEFFGQDALTLFPFGHDGAGDVFAAKVNDLPDDSIYFADHETLSVEKWKFGFTTWLDHQTNSILENIEQRQPNSKKSWCVQFSFAEVPLEQIVLVLRQVGVVTEVDSNWKQQGVSPAGVRLAKLSLKFEGELLEIEKQEYRSRSAPQLYVNMRESLEVSPHNSKIRRLDALFSKHMPDYNLVDYGPLSMTREP